MSFTVDEILLPATIDDERGADFARTIEIENVHEALAYGTDELAMEPVEVLPYYIDPHNPHRALVARVGGVIVGCAYVEWLLDDDSGTGWITVQVLPEHEGQGVGRALADGIEAIARTEGRTKALSYVSVQDAPGDRLASPTGFGSIPSETRAVRFLLARGYSLEQVERGSRLSLPVAGLDALVAGAAERSGSDYATHTWVGSTPERWRSDMAVLNTRMSTDAPTAGLEEPEDVWTVERVIDADERAAASPRAQVWGVVEHVPSGHLVGYTLLSVPAEVERPVRQYPTLVLREHRGHRLGMLLKVANLLQLEQVAPGHPSVITFNAEENRHMLSVNEALGFELLGYTGAWRRDL